MASYLITESKEMLCFDVLYGKFSKPLPMTLLTAIAFAPFVFEDVNFPPSPVSCDPSRYLGFGQRGCFNLDVCIIANQ
jgi:hypothetical protein